MFIALLCSLVLSAVAVDGSNSEMDRERKKDERQWLEFIAEKQLANRQKFSGFLCEFELTDGFALSEQEALSLGPTKNRRMMKGCWAVSDGRVYYELAGDAEEVEKILRKRRQEVTSTEELKSKRENVLILPCTMKALKTESRTLSFIPFLETATVRSDPSSGEGALTPFNMVGQLGKDESSSAGNLIQLCLKGDTYSCATREETGIGGRNVTVVDFFSASGTLHSSHHLDPARGYLPIELDRYVVDDQPRKGVDVYVVDATEGPDGGWFPMRTVAVFPDRGNGIGVTELRVTRLECDPTAADAAMSVALPAGTHVHCNGSA